MYNYMRLSPKETILISSAIAILISEELNTDEQNFIGNFLLSIGQDILTIAAQSQLIEDKKKQKNVQTNTEKS